MHSWKESLESETSGAAASGTSSTRLGKTGLGETRDERSSSATVLVVLLASTVTSLSTILCGIVPAGPSLSTTCSAGEEQEVGPPTLSAAGADMAASSTSRRVSSSASCKRDSSLPILSSASDRKDMRFCSPTPSGTKSSSMLSSESSPIKVALAIAPTCCCSLSRALLPASPTALLLVLQPPLFSCCAAAGSTMSAGLVRVGISAVSFVGVASPAFTAAVITSSSSSSSSFSAVDGAKVVFASTSLLVSSSYEFRFDISRPIPSSVSTETDAVSFECLLLPPTAAELSSVSS
mmetsp:Transcript_7443/g.16276  ORF Transcript_7443/g.16276 Transcript_7443/m.16276 type:complete len:293 (+) Transcript_7443:1500-2378(+)